MSRPIIIYISYYWYILFFSENMELNSPTFEGETPLWIAARNNSIEASKILLQAGALVNIPNHEEVTPLHYGM